MSTILTSTIIENAKNSVEDYIINVNALNSDLEAVMRSLTNNFAGEACDGYLEFYNQKVLPALTDNLVGEGSSITANIKLILDNIQQQLLDTVDPQLGDNNRNPSGDT